jgi:beta-1,4-mannosyl-glycoprotein beta-1,4-N-acetylglucosaminyltransferase
VIYDTFPFFNELDLLEIRLHELDPVVDFFVLVEAAHTHAGKPKPLHYQNNKQRFAGFAKKIIHVIVEDMPSQGDAWVRERFQRDAIPRGLTACRDEDWILMSDVDEIPCAEAVRETIRAAEKIPLSPAWLRKLRRSSFTTWALRRKFKKFHPAVWVFHQRPSAYYLNLVRDTPGPATRLLRFGDLDRPSKLRRWGGKVVKNGGWHFTCVGDIATLQEKIRAFAHQEYNTPETLDPKRLAQQVERGEFVFAASGGGGEFHAVPIDETFPAYLRENAGKFSHLIKPVK